MGFKKGDKKPANSGKKKGSRHKLTRVREACEEAGFSPAHFLIALAQGDREALGVANRTKLTIKDRAGAAEALLDRLDPKLKSLEFVGHMDASVTFLIEGPQVAGSAKEWEEKWSPVKPDPK
jgi:hypothetical protein